MYIHIVFQESMYASLLPIISRVERSLANLQKLFHKSISSERMWIAYKECAYAECHNLIYMYVTIYIYAGLAHGRNKKMREAYNQSRAQFIFISKWGKENMPFMD